MTKLPPKNKKAINMIKNRMEYVRGLMDGSIKVLEFLPSLLKEYGAKKDEIDNFMEDLSNKMDNYITSIVSPLMTMIDVPEEKLKDTSDNTEYN